MYLGEPEPPWNWMPLLIVILSGFVHLTYRAPPLEAWQPLKTVLIVVPLVLPIVREPVDTVTAKAPPYTAALQESKVVAEI